jgi:hypothetical protein
LNKSLSLIGRWSADHGWQSRVAAWDAEQDCVKREGYLEEVREVGRRQAQTVRRHVEVLSLPALELGRRIERDEAHLADMDIPTLIGLAVKTSGPLAKLLYAEREAVRLQEEDPESGNVCPSCRAREGTEDVSNWTREQARQYLLGMDDAETKAEEDAMDAEILGVASVSTQAQS